MKTITDLSFEDFKLAARHMFGSDYCLTPRKLYRNYRDDRGLNLSYIGVLIMENMGYQGYEYRFDRKTQKVTTRIRTLFDQYFQCPYYLDNNRFIIFDTESIALFKLYGTDLEAWVEHMNENIQDSKDNN